MEDNGRGIHDDVKSSIFSRRKSDEIKSMSTGPGLFIVKALVESFGGTARVEDRVSGDHSQGAKFVVMLPAVEDHIYNLSYVFSNL